MTVEYQAFVSGRYLLARAGENDVMAEINPLNVRTTTPGLVLRIKRWLRADDVGEEAEEDNPMYARAETRIVVGLGNPGRQYANTRHNAGWMVIDEIAKRANADGSRTRLQAEITEVRYKGFRLILAKPQTYMNESGRAVRELLNWYKADMDDLLVITDDLDIPFGRLRLRPNGSAGGHNGLKSIIRETGSDEFARLRVGIGRPEQAGRQAIGHVLSTFSSDEQAQVATVIGAAADATESWLETGLLATMNVINGVPSVVSEP